MYFNPLVKKLGKSVLDFFYPTFCTKKKLFTIMSLMLKHSLENLDMILDALIAG